MCAYFKSIDKKFPPSYNHNNKLGRYKSGRNFVWITC